MNLTKKTLPLCLALFAAWLLLGGFNTSAENISKKQTEEKSTENKENILKEWEDRVLANVDDYVNVREDATTDSAIVGRLYDGDGGTILERKNGWTKIRSGNLEGYVRNDFLLFGEDAYELAQEKLSPVATVNTDGLRIRSEADLDAKILKVTEEGTKYPVIEDADDDSTASDKDKSSKDDSSKDDSSKDDSDEWVQIEYAEDKTGYVAAEYVSVQYELGEGMTMEEIKKKEAEEKKEKLKQQLAAFQANGDELRLLAALIQAEGGGQPYDGKVAIAAVVMNRVKSARYPNTIAEVIYAPGQFGPASNGTLNKYYTAGPSAECMQAAQDAINGYTTIGSFTHFRRAGADVGENSIVIGNHVYY